MTPQREQFEHNGQTVIVMIGVGQTSKRINGEPTENDWEGLERRHAEAENEEIEVLSLYRSSKHQDRLQRTRAALA